MKPCGASHGTLTFSRECATDRLFRTRQRTYDGEMSKTSTLINADRDLAQAGSFRLQLRLDLGAGARIGPGKVDLIEAVGRTGSISAAGRDLGMSYRRAWLLLDAVNRMFEEPVVTASVGGAHGGGAVVTPLGQALIAAYRALEAECAAAADSRFAPFVDRLRANPEAGPGDHDD
jgi:molybdate transport system regulatory protein